MNCNDNKQTELFLEGEWCTRQENVDHAIANGFMRARKVFDVKLKDLAGNTYLNEIVETQEGGK